MSWHHVRVDRECCLPFQKTRIKPSATAAALLHHGTPRGEFRVEKHRKFYVLWILALDS